MTDVGRMGNSLAHAERERIDGRIMNRMGRKTYPSYDIFYEQITDSKTSNTKG